MTAENKDFEMTMETLRESQYKLPEYDNSYDEQINKLYSQIVSRPDFRYDPSRDSLYGQYRQQYSQLGQRAMRDTMGQAASLTGGYGSSYAQSVGQQEYDEYMQRLSEVLPELYDRAYQRYRDQGDSLEKEYERMLAMEDRDYQRYRDQVSDYEYRQGMISKDDDREYDRSMDEYEKLFTLIGRGYVPTEEEMARTGLTAEHIKVIKSGSSGGGSSGRYSPTYFYKKNSGGKESNDGEKKENSNMISAAEKLAINSSPAAQKLYSEHIRGRIL